MSCTSSSYYGIVTDYQFPDEMKAVIHLLIKKYNNKYTFIKRKFLNIYGDECSNDENNEHYNKFIESLSLEDNIIVNDIHVEVKSYEIDKNNDKNSQILELKKINLTLYSDTNNIEKFIKYTLDEFRKYQKSNKDIDELKIFTYVKNLVDETENKHKLIFNEKILSNKKDILNYETFEHIYNDNKELIMSEINKLQDEQFHKKYGLKRKLCYLFYGGYGTGKTSFITAIANEYNRHILEIPFSRIKTNEEFEELINIKKINGTHIDNNKLIIVFDEIDRNNDIICGDDTENDTVSNSKKDTDMQTDIIVDAIKQSTEKKIKIKNTENDYDSLNMSFVLSKLDGLGNYNGLIIIATTNNIDKIHPALCRDMRMTKIEFTYMTKKNIVDMIEKNFETKLEESIKNKLPDIDNCISGATCKLLLKNNYDNLDNFLEKLYEKK